jgi:iron complex transport system substrate-binding protein
VFVVWTEPLISIGKHTFIADALRRAGAVSVIDSSQNWPQVNLEEVVRLQPDYLIFVESHSGTQPHSANALADLPGWRLLNAVRARRYATISDAINRPAPRLVSAIEDLARQLHPDAFAGDPQNDKTKATPPRSAVLSQPAAHVALTDLRTLSMDPLCAR